MEAAAGPGKPPIDTTSILLVLITILLFALPVFALFPPISPSPSDFLRQTHLQVGKDIHRPSPIPKSSSPSPAATLCELWIYPIKSCRGISVSRSKVLPEGLEFDRLFTFAQLKSPFPVALADSEKEKGAHAWEFVTQRQFPLLATVRVDLFVPDAAKARAPDSAGDEAFVVLRFPWREDGWRGALGWAAAKLRRGWRAAPEMEVVLPVAFPSPEEIARQGYEFEVVRIWKEDVRALNMERELPEELQLYLGVSNKLALFRVNPDELREVYRCAPRVEEAGYQPVTGFQDAYPLHMLNLRSVSDLDCKIAKDEHLRELDARRFRANIIIDGVEPYDEETWATIRCRPSRASKGQDADFHVSCRTVRCKMPNVDPDNGYRHKVEPDKSLRKHRDVDAGAPLKGCLGMQLTPLYDGIQDSKDMQTWVEVGMAIEVLTRGSHKYVKQ